MNTLLLRAVHKQRAMIKRFIAATRNGGQAVGHYRQIDKKCIKKHGLFPSAKPLSLAKE